MADNGWDQLAKLAEERGYPQYSEAFKSIAKREQWVNDAKAYIEEREEWEAIQDEARRAAKGRIDQGRIP